MFEAKIIPSKECLPWTSDQLWEKLDDIPKVAGTPFFVQPCKCPKGLWDDRWEPHEVLVFKDKTNGTATEIANKDRFEKFLKTTFSCDSDNSPITEFGSFDPEEGCCFCPICATGRDVPQKVAEESMATQQGMSM